MDNPYGYDECAAGEQATVEMPCWGSCRVFDSIVIDSGEDEWPFLACEGHYPGMWIAGRPCSLEKYMHNIILHAG